MVTATVKVPFELNSHMVKKNTSLESRLFTVHHFFVRSSGQAGTGGHLGFFEPRGRVSGLKAVGGRRRENLFLSIFLASS